MKFISIKNKLLSFYRSNRLLLVSIFFLTLTLMATAWSLVKSPYIEGNVCFYERNLEIPIIHYKFSYHMNCDSFEYLRASKDFPDYFIEHKTRIARPGYPALTRAFHEFYYGINKYSVFDMKMLAAFTVNLLLGFGAALILYLLTRKYFSEKIALLSGLLLITSSHYHIFLAQVHTEIAGDFIIVASLLMLDYYIRNKTTKNLIILSFLAGLLMLIKFVIVIPIFIGLIALWYKKIKELIIFSALFLLPFFLWVLYVIKILNTEYSTYEAVKFHQGDWFIPLILNIGYWPSLIKTFFISTLLFIVDIFTVFYLIIPLLALFGLLRWKNKYKYVIFSLFTASFIFMLFIILWGAPRMAFGLFPLIIPLSLFGYFKLSEELKMSKVFSIIILFILLASYMIVSQSNIYEIIKEFDYNNIREFTNIGRYGEIIN